MSNWLILFAVLLPVMTGVATLFLKRSLITPRVFLALLGPLAAFLILVTQPIVGIQDTGLVEKLGTPIAWMPTLNIEIAFLTDGLGLFFALLVSGIGCLIVLYARGYFGRDADSLFRFYPTLGFFTTAMLGVVLSDYLLMTLLFWEMTSISSFLLIGWDRYDKKAVKLAMQAFFTTGMGGMALFGGIVLFGGHTGIWRWSEFVQSYNAIDFSSAPMIWAFVLLFIGAGTKSAQWPFHYWLPGAMAAPTPVSAFLHSATMVKAGVFLVGRLFPVFGATVAADGALAQGFEFWPGLIVCFGAVTMLYGGITAVNQHDLKRIFAYTTVSQLGLLMAMYGLGGFTYAHDGHLIPTIDLDITQIANHAFYKAPLFITAGAIGHILSRNITRLNGAFWKYPAICATMLAAGYALAAGPGTVSFQAKELFLYAIYHAAKENPWLWIVMGMTVLTAVCNVAIFIRLVTTLFGLPGGMNESHAPDFHEHHHHHDHEHGFWPHLIWLPAVPLVLFQYVGGIATPVWNEVFMAFESNVFYFEKGVPTLWYVMTHPGIPLYMSLLAIGLGIVLGFSPLLRGEHKDINDYIYPSTYWTIINGGGFLFRLIQTGNLRHYTLFVLLAYLVGFFGALYYDPSMKDVFAVAYAELSSDWLANMPGILIALVVCASAILLPFTTSRFLRVLLLGTCGFSVVGMYLVYQAPDLALTQLMVEIISVILFVFVLRLLPVEKASVTKRIPLRLIFAVATGVAFTWMTLVGAVTPADERLAMVHTPEGSERQLMGQYYAEHSYSATENSLNRSGGGDNIVNVILVDFRGFDTYGEIIVLGLAGLGVWSLMPGRRRRLLALPFLKPSKKKQTSGASGAMGNVNPPVIEGGAA